MHLAETAALEMRSAAAFARRAATRSRAAATATAATPASSRSLSMVPMGRGNIYDQRWPQQHAVVVLRASGAAQAHVAHAVGHAHVPPRRYLSEGGGGIFSDMKQKMEEQDKDAVSSEPSAIPLWHH